MNNEDDKVKSGWHYTIVPISIIDDERVGPHELAVFVVLCRHANQDGMNAFPKLDTIQKKTTMARATVVKAIKKLIEFGYVKKERRGAKSNLYTVIDPIEVQEMNYRSSGDELHSSSRDELELDPSSNEKPITSEQSPQDSQNQKPFLEQFEAWYLKYPRKIGKQVAYKKFVARMREGEDAAILENARDNYAREKEGTEKKYVLHPATFLSDYRYEDYVREAEPEPEYRYCPKCGAPMGTAGSICARCDWEWESDDGEREDSDRSHDTEQLQLR